MVTGAWQEVHGVTFNWGYHPITVDSIFSLAHAASMKTAEAGSGFWQDNFASQGVEAFPRYPKELHGARAEDYVEYQRKICEGLPNFIRNSPAQFVALDLNATDDASHDLGPLSEGTAIWRSLRGLPAGSCLRRIDGWLSVHLGQPLVENPE